MSRSADTPPADARAPQGARGFTLIEVVVALAIVALGMLALFGAVSDAANNVAWLRDRTLASWIAADRVAELRLSGEYPSVDESGGDVEMAGRHWHWTAKVSDTAVAGLRRVDVSVRRADDPAESSVAQATGFLGEALQAAVPSSTPWQGPRAGGPNPNDEGPVRPPRTPRTDGPRPPRRDSEVE